MWGKNVKVYGSGLMSVEDVVQKCNDIFHTHQSGHFHVTLTFLHDIFHTHQTTSMQTFTFLHDSLPHSSEDFHTPLHFCMERLPHSSDYFVHAPLHFCTTSSTLIRLLPCTFTFLHDSLPHSSDHFHAP